MKRILLAVDQFDSGQVALTFAADLALTVHADVIVVHVRERPFNPRVVPLERVVDGVPVPYESDPRIRMSS